MQLLDGRLVFAPTDLAGFSRCDHLTSLDRQWAEAKAAPFAPPIRSPFAELLSHRGRESEADYAAGVENMRKIDLRERTTGGYADAAEATIQTMREGVPKIYQPVFFDRGWVGVADFLMRVERPTALGDWGYEALDVKLARDVRPHFILQLCSYSEQLARIQAVEPETMHIALGSGRTVPFRWGDFAAYYRRLKSRFADAITNQPSTSPYPNEFCELCHWGLNCWRQWEREDHLSLVANIRRQHVQRLVTSGVVTLTALGDSVPQAERFPQFKRETLQRLHDQARLQLAQRRSGQLHREFLPLEEGRGFSRLPSPSPGDLYFDVEADPLVGDDGITYLFGLASRESGGVRYVPRWAHDDRAEREAFQKVVDSIVAQRLRDPAMHVYHYGAADVSTLKRLMGKHGTREEEVDELLRSSVFVDLYSVVRQALRVSLPSYSLKKVEEFYFTRRERGVADAGGAIVAYEQWLDTADEALLHTIEGYNREDCESVAGLQDWLAKLRAEAEKQFQREIPWWAPAATAPLSEEASAARKEEDELADALSELAPEGAESPKPEGKASWLLAQLVRYHRREEKPAWWWHFTRREMSAEDLLEDHESIAEIVPRQDVPPTKDKKSTIFALKFPPQQHKFGPGDSPIDPKTDKGAGEIVALDDQTGLLQLRRGPSLEDVALPTALIPAKPVNTSVIRQALRRLSRDVLRCRFSSSQYRAVADLLVTRIPRIRGAASGTPLQDEHMKLEDIQKLVARLDDSFLFIQGPPGAGKTWTGARLIVDLLKQKRRVGIAASTHRAIHNLLHEVEAVAVPAGLPIRGLKKRSEDDDTEYESKFGVRSPIGNSSNIKDFLDPTLTLIAGTAWLFSNQQLDKNLDYLFIDEAGQVSLANAVAMSMAARNVVLLGDPLQLAQVSQGVHPGTAGDSALQHILGTDATIPPSRGIFLEHTWRMHPEVCRFVSEVVYDNRLHSAPGRERQRIESRGFNGAGIRFIAVAHEGNARFSREEANRVRDEIRMLLDGGTFTDSDGRKRPLAMSDVMVVTPYNAQVRCVSGTLRSAGLNGVEVGTVDKFQGREAPVVFYSMATSAAEDSPRELDFLFSRNRLNVAVSRAKCLSVLVASPRLLDAPCSTAEQMRLANGVCRFVELAPP